MVLLGNINWVMESDISYQEMTRGNIAEPAPRISVDEKIRFGKPVISGTRVPIELIIGKLAIGMTCKEVMAEYEITRGDILAALDPAAKVLSGEKIKAVG